MKMVTFPKRQMEKKKKILLCYTYLLNGTLYSTESSEEILQ